MAESSRPKLGTFNHASIPVRDLEQAKCFYTEVLGGEVTLLPAPGFAEVRLGGAVIGLSEQKSGWTGSENEYPHYAFTMAAEDFYPFIENLKARGVKTGPVWTRHGVEALMYFRDPSGNLLEIYCERRATCWSSTAKAVSKTRINSHAAAAITRSTSPRSITTGGRTPGSRDSSES